MGKIVWDQTGDKFYETGTKNGVLYVASNGEYKNGVAWNGLTAVTESPAGADASDLYADDIKYLSLRAAETFGATIEAYTYPEEFAICDGSISLTDGVTIGQQKRKTFGLSFRTVLGNDTDNEDYGYKLHLIYGATASPSTRSYQTINESPEAITFSWEVSTVPVNVAGYKPTSLVTIDSTKADAAKLAAFEDILYGSNATAFDASKTYAVGDYVYYDGKNYKCKTAITTPADWNASDWEVTTDLDARLPLPDEVATLLTA